MPGVEGATYTADLEVTLVKMPQEAPEQLGPEADHVTPEAATSFCTVAVTASVCVIVRPPRLGEMVTLRAEEEPVIVMIAEPLLAVFETDVAVSVTVAGLGTLGGAV
jgi:hypothetical protein